MLTIRYETTFRRDYKRVIRRGYDPSRIAEVISMLAAQTPLPEQCHDHPLSGNWNGFRECHITPDWLLVYHISQTELTLCLTRTGTHSDIFKK